MRNAYRILVRKLERRKQYGRSRYEGDSNVEIVIDTRIWIGFVSIRIKTRGWLL